MRVFVVEDSESVRERLVKIISGIPGVQVNGWAGDADDATKKILQSRPDVVVLDIRLNQSTGFDVLEHVKKSERPPVIIVLTNFPYPQYRKKYLGSGADYFFDKSTEFDQAIGTLKKLVKSSGPASSPPRLKWNPGEALPG